MSVLPRGWVEARLGEICHLQNGRAYKQEELLSSGKYIVLRVGNFFTSSKWYYSDLELEPTKYCDDGDLLYAWSASFGPRIWSGGKVIFHYHIWRVDLESNISDRDFVFHWFNWDKENIKAAHGTGSTMIHVTKGDMEQRRISLPPLAEQQRIVAKLDTLNTKSARARTELARIETLVSRYKQAVLIKALSGELTREWRIAEQFEEWLRVEPQGLFRWSSGKNLPSRDYEGGDVPVIGGNGVSGYHNIANTEAPTIVIGRVGALCGNVYHSEGPAWITDNAIYAKWIAPEVDLRFAVLVYEVADLNKMSGGTGQPYVNQSILNSIDFPLPRISEQHEIVRRIESAFAKIDGLAKEAKRALELLGRLDEAILAKAFRGELVRQDENDEPAEHLLARIRAERGKAPKEKKRVFKRTSAMLTASDFLNAKLPNWPREGISFQDLRREFSGSYDDLKDAVFTLLSDENALLRQVFDENQSAMTLRKREQ